MEKTNIKKESVGKVPNRILASLLGLGFVISLVCMVYLVQSGVSLRLAPVISPSPLKSDLKEMTDSLFVRLLPELRPHHYIVWGALPLTGETQKMLNLLLERHRAIYKEEITLIPDGTLVDDNFIQQCPKPCWILLPKANAHELDANPWIEGRASLKEKGYNTLSIVSFQRPQTKPVVSDVCLHEKRLDMTCLTEVAMRDAWKKMKSAEERYFFVRQYNQRGLFLFMQEK